MLVRGHIFETLCKTCLALLVSSSLLVACSSSKDSKPGAAPGPTAEDNKTVFFKKVVESEEQLKNFGIHFDVSQEYDSQSNKYYYDFDKPRQEVVKVVVRTTATDQDLVATGRKLEDRDNLLKQMGDLWTVVEANGYQQNRTDASLMAAVMKVKLIRRRSDITQIMNLADQIRAIHSASDELTLERKDAGLSLWPLRSSQLTNAEASKTIEDRLALNARFEAIKTLIADPLIREMDGEPAGVGMRTSTLREATKLQLLTGDEITSLTDLRNDLAKRAPTDRFDTNNFATINRELINRKRAQILAEVDRQVAIEMINLNLRFAAPVGEKSIEVDPQSASEARVKGKFGSLSYNQSRVAEKAKAYLYFATKYGAESVPPQGEMLLLSKVYAFLKL